jgi:hypothetical protein
MPSSEMLCHVGFVRNDVSEEHVASIFRVEKYAVIMLFLAFRFFYLEDEGDTFLRNVGSHKTHTGHIHHNGIWGEVTGLYTLNLSTRWRCAVSFIPWHPRDRRLGGPRDDLNTVQMRKLPYPYCKLHPHSPVSHHWPIIPSGRTNSQKLNILLNMKYSVGNS